MLLQVPDQLAIVSSGLDYVVVVMLLQVFVLLGRGRVLMMLACAQLSTGLIFQPALV